MNATETRRAVELLQGTLAGCNTMLSSEVKECVLLLMSEAGKDYTRFSARDRRLNRFIHRERMDIKDVRRVSDRLKNFVQDTRDFAYRLMAQNPELMHGLKIAEATIDVCRPRLTQQQLQEWMIIRFCQHGVGSIVPVIRQLLPHAQMHIDEQEIIQAALPENYPRHTVIEASAAVQQMVPHHREAIAMYPLRTQLDLLHSGSWQAGSFDTFARELTPHIAAAQEHPAVRSLSDQTRGHVLRTLRMLASIKSVDMTTDAIRPQPEKYRNIDEATSLNTVLRTMPQEDLMHVLSALASHPVLRGSLSAMDPLLRMHRKPKPEELQPLLALQWAQVGVKPAVGAPLLGVYKAKLGWDKNRRTLIETGKIGDTPQHRDTVKEALVHVDLDDLMTLPEHPPSLLPKELGKTLAGMLLDPESKLDTKTDEGTTKADDPPYTQMETSHMFVRDTAQIFGNPNGDHCTVATATLQAMMQRWERYDSTIRQELQCAYRLRDTARINVCAHKIARALVQSIPFSEYPATVERQVPAYLHALLLAIEEIMVFLSSERRHGTFRQTLREGVIEEAATMLYAQARQRRKQLDNLRERMILMESMLQGMRLPEHFEMLGRSTSSVIRTLIELLSNDDEDEEEEGTADTLHLSITSEMHWHDNGSNWLASPDAQQMRSAIGAYLHDTYPRKIPIKATRRFLERAKITYGPNSGREPYAFTDMRTRNKHPVSISQHKQGYYADYILQMLLETRDHLRMGDVRALYDSLPNEYKKMYPLAAAS